MPCPSDEVLGAFVRGELEDEEMQALHRHADECADCRRLIAALASDAQSTLPGAPPEKNAPGEPDELPSESGVTPSAAHIGRYQILRHVASGGMGKVYAAYDPELDRRVALKVLARADESSQELQVRLQREAQAMARLAHPNVVSVHDVGTHHGRVFLAMEFVEGATLRRWLKEAKRSWREIRDVFVQAGRGLGAAHAVGLVHRDFKPDNVLIGQDGRVRVADFGLARPGQKDAPSADATPASSPALRSPLIESQITEIGRVMGTPRYMAPEQIRAEEADPRTDQFAFGVALYESLYGVRAFKSRELAERLREIQAGKIQPPAAGHGVPEWLGQAARRAMSAAPEDRFPSMDAMLDAMTRDQRRRTGAGVLAAATAVLVAAIGGGAYALRPDLRCKGAERKLAGVWDDGRRQAIRAAFVATGAPAAEAHFHRTAQALDAYAGRWAGMAEEVCSATYLRKEQPESVLALQTACLDLRLKELKALSNLFTGADAKLAGKAADAALDLSSVRSCGDVAALSEVSPLPDDAAARAEIQKLRGELAEVSALRLAGQYASALDRATRIAEESKPLRYRPLEAEALLLRGRLEDQLGKGDEATRTLVAALNAGEAGRADLVKVQAATRLVFSASQQGKYDEGLRWAEAASASLERIRGNPEQEGELLTNLGSLYMFQDKHEEAAARYEGARRLLLAELGPEHPKTLIAVTNLANAYSLLGRTKEAIRLLEDAIPTIARVRGPDHPVLIMALWTLTHARLQRQQNAEAHESIERALEIARARLGPEHLRVAHCLELEATAYQQEKRFAESLAAYREALRIKQKALGASDPQLAFAYDGIGQSQLGLGKPEEAVAALETALKLRGALPGDRADTQFGLAKALWAMRRDTRRAIALAASARDGYARAKRPEQAKAVDEWLSEPK